LIDMTSLINSLLFSPLCLRGYCVQQVPPLYFQVAVKDEGFARTKEFG
jgi:hypothetical protein